MNYIVPECNLEKLTDRVEKLIKRARKLGSSPITFVVGESIQVPIVLNNGAERYRSPKPGEAIPNEAQVVGYNTYHLVIVEGEAPKLNGWTLAATLQRVELEDGSVTGILRTAGEQQIPAEMRDRVGECDHCKAARYRNDVFVVKHEDGRFAVVGSTCLADFLGHQSPEQYAAIAEYLGEIGELCAGAEDDDFFGYGERTPDVFDVDRVLAIGACVIRLDGFKSRAKANEESYVRPVMATADLVSKILCTNPSCSDYREIKEKYVVIEADENWQMPRASGRAAWPARTMSTSTRSPYSPALPESNRAASAMPLQ